MSGHAIHIKIDDRTYSGTYKVDRQVLTVTTNYGKKTAQLGSEIQHTLLADQLLHELVREEKGRKRLADLICVASIQVECLGLSRPCAARRGPCQNRGWQPAEAEDQSA
jgi:hypothetical protein